MALLKCPECGKDVSSSAQTCPSCGHPLKKRKKEKKKGSCLTKILGVIIVFFVLVFAIAGVDDNEENNAVTKIDSKTKQEKEIEYIEISSSDLIDIYNENQVKCKQNYDKKSLAVTGKVQSVGTDVMNNTYVCLGHDSDFTFIGIQCYTKDNEQINIISELKEGDTITVYGKGECGSLSFTLSNIKIKK